MRERRLGTPAGTVPRRDDTKPHTIAKVVDGRLDPRLHALACQMIAAEDDVDRLAPEPAQRAAAGSALKQRASWVIGFFCITARI